jgi:serine/threonine-protein kinase
MGRPSLRSDVFSIGLIMYRMLSGRWPEWPFEWPGPGYRRLRGRIHPDFIALLKKCIDPKPQRRYRDADQLLNAFRRIKAKTLRHAKIKRKRAA